MDDRKKKIGELEKAEKNNQAALNSLLRDLGGALLTRPGIDSIDGGALHGAAEAGCGMTALLLAPFLNQMNVWSFGRSPKLLSSSST